VHLAIDIFLRLIGLSANNLKDHAAWVKDINEFGTRVNGETDVQFPIVSADSA
jgi:hypothetical protein